jgi:hypothetical protein
MDEEVRALVSRQREALSEFLKANSELFLPSTETLEELDFVGAPMLYGAVLVISILDTEDWGAESVLTVKTPGLRYTEKIGLLSSSLHDALED